jgi:hypothetical protein
MSSLDIQRVDYEKEREREQEREKGREKRRQHLQPAAHNVGRDPPLPQLHSLVKQLLVLLAEPPRLLPARLGIFFGERLRELRGVLFF